MKNIFAFLLAIVSAFTAVGCTRGDVQKQENKQSYFNGIVIENHDDSLVVEVADAMESELHVGSQIEVSKDVISADGCPDVTVGALVRVVFSGSIQDSHTAELENVFAIYLLDVNGDVIPPDSAEPKVEPISIKAEDVSVFWVNWSENYELYLSALNSGKLTDGEAWHLPIYKFNTADELDNFKNKFADILSFDYGYDGPSFNEASGEYGDEFFAENTLFIVYVTASSGSFRFGVRDDAGSIYCDGNLLCIHAEQLNFPEVFTDDMAGWFICVAVKSSAIEGCGEFDAVLDTPL